MDNEWMAQGKCRDMDPAVFFPSDGIGVQDCAEGLLGMPREGAVPRVRPPQPGRPRRVGRHLQRERRRDPAAAPDLQPAGQPQLTPAAPPGCPR